MKKISSETYFWLLIAPIFIWELTACKTTAASKTAVSVVKTTTSKVVTSAEAPLEKALLWKIEGKKIKTPSYLYGTIHLIPKKDFAVTSQMQEGIKSSKKLVAELDVSQLMISSLKIFQLAPMKNGTKLKDLLSESEYKEVFDYFSTNSDEAKFLGIENLMTWKPLTLESFLYTKILAKSNGTSAQPEPTTSVEMELLEVAQANQLSFGGLETIDDQMAIFDSIPYKKQATQLLESIRSLKNSSVSKEADFEKLLKLYKNQDIDGMHQEFAKDESMSPSEMAMMLDNRNKRWIPLIEQMTATEPIFIAVGAGHLGGTNGLVRLLQKKGYKVTAVKQ
jgi:uncharacterized protein YbaP (TraB family)